MTGRDTRDGKARDKRLGRLIRSCAKNDRTSKVSRKLQADATTAIQDASQRERDTLSRAFAVVRDHRDDVNRLSAPEYVTLLTELLNLGFPESAAAFFAACVGAIAKVDFKLFRTAVPSASCVDLWLKQSKTPKKVLLRTISDSPDEYYQTAWCDWFLKKAPVKTVLPFAAYAVQGRSRPAYLPAASELLVIILSRDRKSVLTDLVLKETSFDPGRTKLLVAACACIPWAGMNYARSLGLTLTTEEGARNVRPLVGAFDELLHSPDESLSRFVAQFVAHVATTFRLAAAPHIQTLAGVEDVLRRVGIGLLLSMQGDSNRDLWFASTTHAVAKEVLAGKGKVSPQGAMEVALALRAAQTDAGASEALWSAAFNLGIREIGKRDSNEQFDPTLHEDIRGGLLRGDNARVVRCGWRLGDVVLLRAHVEPT
jgi:hypothetical protein